MAREKLCVGVDIGASSVKLCQLKKTGRGYTLERFGMVALPTDTVVDSALMNSAHVVQALQELVSTCRIKHKQVALAISGHSVIIKKITLPQMSRQELDNSINWEAEQFIPFDIADVYMDVQIVGPSANAQGQMDVLLVAAKKEFVDEYTSVVFEAGLEPIICDVDAFAVETVFETNYEANGPSSVALVNVGAAKTNVNIVSHGTSAFTRDLSLGGYAFTEEIQKTMGLSQEDAEQVKINHSTLPDHTRVAMVGVANNICADIQRSIDFYTATSAEQPPSDIYVSGGSAHLTMLLETMRTQIGVPVHTFDPFRKILPGAVHADPMKKVAAVAAVAVGLALRYPGDG